MKILNQYRILFTGLKLGKHAFEFKIDKQFFDEFEYSIVKNGLLDVQVDLEKQETMMVLDFHIIGTLELTCDVCLNQFQGKTDIKERLIVKFNEDEDVNNSTDELLVLKKGEYELDLATVIYEYINLSVPYYSRCDQQGSGESCDQLMIERLKNLSSTAKEEQTDPRWDILKHIKNN